MKFNSILMKTVQKDLEKGNIPMLLGEPGIGKSSWLIDLGNLMHTQVFVLPCNQLADKADLTGSRLVPDGNGSYETRFYPHTVINQAINYANDHPHETPILFLDELNRTTPDVTSEALSIPTLRSIGDVKLPDNLRVVTAGNDKGNITSLDTASITRFVLYHVTPDVDTFLSLDPELNVFVRNVLTAHPETILCKEVQRAIGMSSNDDDDDDQTVDVNEILDDGETMQQMATPRTISGISRWLNSFDNKELQSLCQDTYIIDGEETSALQEALEGHTGKTAFTAFLLAEIAAGIMTTNNQSNVMQVPKPQCYDKLVSFNTVDELEKFVGTMSPNDKSGSLIYAMSERKDNSKLITTLLDNMSDSDMTAGDTKMMMKLCINDMLDESNKNIFLNAQHPLSQKFALLMDV